MTYDDWKTTDPRGREPEEREEEPEQETIITQVGDGALFDMRPSTTIGRPHIDVLPCSVIELETEKHSQRRAQGHHDGMSSRAEFSHFPTVVGDLCMQLFLRNATHIYDPFAGWGERASLARQYGKHYVGIDCNPAAIAFARERYDVENQLADATTFTPSTFDALLTCPPYWNLESYSPGGIDALPTWSAFTQQLMRIFTRAYLAAADNAIFCILSGDWRDRGVYYDLTYRINTAMCSVGATQIDSVVVSRLNISKVKIMIPQAVRLGYTVKVHETLNVFTKSVASHSVLK